MIFNRRAEYSVWRLLSKKRYVAGSNPGSLTLVGKVGEGFVPEMSIGG